MVESQQPNSRNFVKTFQTMAKLEHTPGGDPTDWMSEIVEMGELDGEINRYARENNLRIEGIDLSLFTEKSTVTDTKIAIRIVMSVRFVDYEDWAMDEIATRLSTETLLTSKGGTNDGADEEG